MDDKKGLDIVVEKLLLNHPIQMDLVDCGALIGMKERATRTARCRKTFPIKTQKIGGRVVVFTHDLIDYLKSGIGIAKIVKKAGKGRPTKVEQGEAKCRGVTVRELRAQLATEVVQS